MESQQTTGAGGTRPGPDVETASEGYARRFSGAAGAYLLEVQSQGLEHLMSDLRPDSIIEVGGGHGQLVANLLRRKCRLTMFGSDGTHAGIRQRYTDAPIDYATGDLLQLPFADRSFDVVVAVRLLAHVSDWRALLAELCRVARVCVIIDYPSWRSLNALTPLFFGAKKRIEQNTRPYASFFPSQISGAFRLNGFNAFRSYGQFLLPMAAHRALDGARPLQTFERACRRVGLTALFGSPILLRAERGKGQQSAACS